MRVEYSDGTYSDIATGDLIDRPEGKSIKYIYYGQYPQSIVHNVDPKSSIATAQYDANGYATVDGITYKKVTTKGNIMGYWGFKSQVDPRTNFNITELYPEFYFRSEPIK